MSLICGFETALPIYVHVQKDKQGALSFHIENCIFIKHLIGYRNLKFCNLSTKQVTILEHIILLNIDA